MRQLERQHFAKAERAFQRALIADVSFGPAHNNLGLLHFYRGELYPAVTVEPSAMGFDYDHEVTPMHIATEGVTTQYFGNSGELYPEE